MNRIVEEDINQILDTDFIDWEQFRDSSFLVTGATGLLGKWLIWTMVMANVQKNLNMQLYALVRNEQKAQRYFADTNIHYIVQDITKPITLDKPIDYIIHCANITDSKLMVERPVETWKTTVLGTTYVLEFAKEKHIKSMVYLSSMEMYGVIDKPIVLEEDQGYIDLLNVRSSYPEGKRASENLCASYKSEYGIPVVIARLAQTFGAGIDSTENRVFAQFARSIIEKKDLVMHTYGEKRQSFCYISDAITGILILLLKGKSPEAYNVVNPDTYTSIREMAEMLVSVYSESGCKVVFDVPEKNIFGYAPDSKLNLSAEKIQKLGWKPTLNLEQIFDRTIKYILQNEYGENE
ncbi:MAG: NAD(P)-dependent oxidoreductase [Lachnospiraceae bacterium]|nr:NAD(P)-dependent oxidoreductase [Lachnospiraceae bacterium]